MRSIKLHKLLSLVGIVPTSRLINPEIKNISFNSKEVEKGTGVQFNVGSLSMFHN